jgi:hypothetical protein
MTRWFAFGFDLPGRVTIPAVPQHLVATPGTTGSRSIFYDWDNAARAIDYRMLIKNNATGDVLVNELVSESEYMATNLPVGITVVASVTGHNGAGDSAASGSVATPVP